MSSDTRVTAGEYLELKKQENSGSGCSENGLVSRDRNGALLSCTNGIWKSASGGSVRTVSASRSGWRFSGSQANCASNEFVVGGGGGCSSGTGWVFMNQNKPNGNGWYSSCDGGMQDQTIYSNTYAICMKK